MSGRLQRPCGCGEPPLSILSEQSNIASSDILVCCCEAWQALKPKSASPSWRTTSNASSKSSAQRDSLRHSHPPKKTSLDQTLDRASSHLVKPSSFLKTAG